LLTFFSFPGWGAYNYLSVQQTKAPSIPPLQIGNITGNIKIGFAAKRPILFQGAQIETIGATILPKPVS
jgi:hypothetical protein